MVIHVPVMQKFGHSVLFDVLSVQPRLTTQPKPDEKHTPLVRQISLFLQRCVTGEVALQGMRPLALLPSGLSQLSATPMDHSAHATTVMQVWNRIVVWA
jgi:hypothetical protein